MDAAISVVDSSNGWMSLGNGRSAKRGVNPAAAKIDGHEDEIKMARVGNRLRVAIAVMVLPVLVGCSDFFVPETTTPSGGGGSSSAGNTVYVGNSARTSLNGFSVVPAAAAVAETPTTPAVPATPAALNRIANLPTVAGFQPISMVITPKNTFLYVGSASGIFLYAINTDGSLTVPSANPTPAGVFAVSMAISPDGQWLIALDGTTQQLDIFQINATTGTLSSLNQPTTYATLVGPWVPTSVVISPNGQFIYASAGTAGDVIFTFNTVTGVAVHVGTLNPPTTTTSDFRLAVDSKSAYLYIARSGTQGGVAVYTIGGNGALSPVTGSPFAAGAGTYDIVLDPTGSFVYAANRGDGTISAYSIVAGTTPAGLTLNQLSTSPYTSGPAVQSIGLDKTGGYLLAAAVGGAPDLTLYSIDTTVPGQLDQVTTQPTDTDPAGAFVLALTH